jgi:hypothetical protein
MLKKTAIFKPEEPFETAAELLKPLLQVNLPERTRVRVRVTWNGKIKELRMEVDADDNPNES